MTFEATQKGNPRRITVNQHTFPKASIERFADSHGFVQIVRTASGQAFKAKPSKDVFCAPRVWNQQAETGFMREIEDGFQVLANGILSGQMQRVNAAESELITKFYCLWNIRFLRKRYRGADQKLSENGVSGVSFEYTKDDQECLEIGGINVIRPDMTLSSRHLVSISIRQEVDQTAATMRGFQWQVVVATDGEFLVPDNFLQYWAVPLSPTMSMIVTSAKKPQKLSRDQVSAINRIAVESSFEYYFARDPSKCPVAPLKPARGHPIKRATEFLYDLFRK